MTTAASSDISLEGKRIIKKKKKKDTERSWGQAGAGGGGGESSFILKVRRGQKGRVSHWEAGEATLGPSAQIWARELKRDSG